MKIKKFDKIFEADIKSNKGVPSSYIEEVERIAKEKYGTRGPSMGDMMEAQRTFMSIMQIQQGNERKLENIAKKIITEYYGDILDGVKLDIKIVRPDDQEKLEMVQKLQKQEQKSNKEKEGPDFGRKVAESEIDKRKILNNIIQGEGLNVIPMLKLEKEEIDKINPQLIDLMDKLSEIDKKMDWKEDANLNQAMQNNPMMANIVDTEYEEDEETGETIPVIKVRALDLRALIHETIKGVYELIMAHAIPEDPEIAEKIKKATYGLKDEQEDIKFGPFIAADLRDYILGYIDRKHEYKIKNISNIKEFIYGVLAGIQSDDFVDLMFFILNKEMNKADFIMKKLKIVETAIDNVTGEVEDYEDSYTGGGNYLQKDDEFDETGYADEDEPKEVQTWKQYNKEVVTGPEEHIKNIKKLNDQELYTYLKTKTSPADRMKIIDQGLDDGDYDIVRKVNEFITKNGR